MKNHRHNASCWTYYEPCSEHHEHDYNCGSGTLGLKCPKINVLPEPTMEKVHPQDLRLLLLSTFRYSLGRMTYIPSETQEMIKRYRNVLHKEDFKQLAEDIRKTALLENLGSRPKLGMDFDRQRWFDFATWCETQ